MVAATLPFDWDALRTSEWREERARKRAVRAEFKRVRDLGLARRHAVKLAQTHVACDGAVGCVAGPAFSASCPVRLAAIDPLDAPGVYDSRSGRVLDECELEVLTHEEMGERLAAMAQPAAGQAIARPAQSELPAQADRLAAAETDRPAEVAPARVVSARVVPADVDRPVDAAAPAERGWPAEGCRDRFDGVGPATDQRRDDHAPVADVPDDGERQPAHAGADDADDGLDHQQPTVAETARDGRWRRRQVQASLPTRALRQCSPTCRRRRSDPAGAGRGPPSGDRDSVPVNPRRSGQAG
jgi:hypothetical protein